MLNIDAIGTYFFYKYAEIVSVYTGVKSRSKKGFQIKKGYVKMG